MSAMRRFVVVAITMMGCACGPEIDDAVLDPEETFTAFCSNLFACPDMTDAQIDYGSKSGCEDVHRADYDMRSSLCRNRVLVLEDCLASLTCQELDDYIEATGSACDEERSNLKEECTGL
jgi:hypothetical protein